ncbi:hypothetical protein NE237_010780 [Protea cynaroides]|uniref:DUF4283 domain-containing protein n=1 Tax=Protea cynaroides TaxID=273540 RepID=A0A9Q0L0G0_9MAGN|nr:hypothetical protein NE237_010780 [Protea cynaroides]
MAGDKHTLHDEGDDETSANRDSNENTFILEEDANSDTNQDDHFLTFIGKIKVNKPYRRQTVSFFDTYIFLFHFKHAIDYANVIRDGPWTVAGNPIILEQWKEQQDWSFDLLEVWAQLHNTPPEIRNAKTASKLVRRLGIPSQMVFQWDKELLIFEQRSLFWFSSH